MIIFDSFAVEYSDVFWLEDKRYSLKENGNELSKYYYSVLI